ncbi:hypothetical protein LINPERHAP2_LOCUS21236 [Linum perenne]
MAKNWGIPSGAQIWYLEDDVWLLDCATKEVVKRVLTLNRCLFGSTCIFLDGWTNGAGRSRCVYAQGRAWVLVQGIPLHLKSLELFRSLGDVCGGFLDYDDKLCPLNSVRLKILATSSPFPT